MRQITEAIVHCTATRADWWADHRTSQKVAEIRRWHVEDRGWQDIGYAYLIDRDGTVAKGRDLDGDGDVDEEIGAHTRGYNSQSIGISLFGGHGSSENDAFEDNFTPEQDRALRALLDELKSKYGFTRVMGHNDYAAKACPGFNVQRWLAHKTPARSSLLSSTTIQASAAGVAATATGGATAIASLDDTAQIVAIVAATVVGLAFLWVMHERIKKWGRGVR